MTGGTRKSTRPPRPSRPGALFSTATLDSAFDNTGTAFTGSDNLKQNFDDFARDFDGILSKARLHDNQTGLALITESGCKTIELFDVPASWEALHKDAVKRMGTELRGPDYTSLNISRERGQRSSFRLGITLQIQPDLRTQAKQWRGPHRHLRCDSFTLRRRGSGTGWPRHPSSDPRIRYCLRKLPGEPSSIHTAGVRAPLSSSGRQILNPKRFRLNSELTPHRARHGVKNNLW